MKITKTVGNISITCEGTREDCFEFLNGMMQRHDQSVTQPVNLGTVATIDYSPSGQITCCQIKVESGSWRHGDIRIGDLVCLDKNIP